MLFILINDKEKDVSSRDGMRRTVETSSYYSGWLESTPHDLKKLKQAIREKDFQLLGETTEANALKNACHYYGGDSTVHLLVSLNPCEQWIASVPCVKKGWPATLRWMPDQMSKCFVKEKTKKLY